MTSLPTLDFSKFTHGSEAEKLELSVALVQSLTNHGFVKLINFGIDDDRIYALKDWSSKFFALPADVKNEIVCHRGPHPQRGWSCVGSEQTSKLRKENILGRNADELADEREHFDAGPLADSEYANKWPRDDALPGFELFMGTTYNIFQETCLTIMEAMELGLGLEAGTLGDRCREAASEIRLNRYPPVSIDRLADGRVKRTWPHTDFGIITLLFQDEVGGLELEDREHPGKFAPVAPAQPGQPLEMVVNISNTFERWTNGVIKAGLHQVTAPPKYKTETKGILPERHSCVFFFKASRDVLVGSHPMFVTPTNPAKFDEITALQYQQQMTKELY